MDGIEIRGVNKVFEKTSVLNNINLTVNRGEFLSILGPSGCGKSTLLRIIAGLEQPTDGELAIAGKEVTNVPTWKRNIGLVFQNFALWPHLSVIRNVSLGLELRKLSKITCRERAFAALKAVQLEHLAERSISQLSGGQQQRVAIARAIVLEPDVLLLDEPLSALDKHLRQEMQVEIKALQQKLNLTTVFVTHDQDEAMSLSDRVVVMNKGKIEQIDTPARIYNWPTSAYVAGFVGDTSLFKGWVTKNSNSAHLRTENGFNVLLEDGPHVEGAEATAFVRPEWISLLAKQQLPRADMPVGTVERVMFFGSSRDYLVRHAGSLIRVKSSNSPMEFDVGDEVGLDFRVRVLPGNPS